jgi:hypothetical protein
MTGERPNDDPQRAIQANPKRQGSEQALSPVHRGKATAARYRRTAEVQARRKQYERSEKGKATRARARARYKAKQATQR